MPGSYVTVFVVPHDMVMSGADYGERGHRLFVSAPPYTFGAMHVYETMPPFLPADRARYVGVAGDIYCDSPIYCGRAIPRGATTTSSCF